MMYTVNTAIPPMATNKTHLSELLTSFAMSFLDLSNNSVIRHLLIYKEQGTNSDYSLKRVRSLKSMVNVWLIVLEACVAKY